MSKATIYHNPNCGTSRNTLAAIRAAGVEPTVVEYLKAGWTKPAELPEEELPGGEDADTGNGTKPEGPRVNYAVGSVEWRAEMERKISALVTDQEENEKTRLARISGIS